MINTSKEYKAIIYNEDIAPSFTDRAEITLKDGTVLNVTEKEIVKNGLTVNDAVSNDNSFQIGTARINTCTLQLNNIEHDFDQYDFTDAIVRPSVGLRLSNNKTEWLKKGCYTVNESVLASSIISLECVDNMNKFDTLFSEVGVTFPCTAIYLLRAVCSYCGVSLVNTTFLNADFTIQRKPSDENITCREIVAWIAQLSCNFARCNTYGALELRWYDYEALGIDLDGGIFDTSTPYVTGDNADGGNFTDYTSGDNYDGGTFADFNRYHHIYTMTRPTIGTDDIVITGVQVKAMGDKSDYGETVLCGTEGYVIQITDNPLIQENTAAIIANSIGAKINGMSFRTCSIEAAADPSREAGDVGYLTYKGNSYIILFSIVNYTIGKFQSISSSAETPSKNNSYRPSPESKTLTKAKDYADQRLTDYDLAVKQFYNLVMHSFGVYHSSEKLADGSTIDYSHDKPTLAESKNIWKQTADVFAVSNDGGKTWRGMDADGNLVAAVLSAIGINAEWIKVLTSFTVGTNFSVDQYGNMTAKNATIQGKIYADSGNIAGMDVTGGGLARTTKINDKTYTTRVYIDGGFWLATSDEYSLNKGFVNTYYDGNGNPVINIAAISNGSYNNDNILLNGYPVISFLVQMLNRIGKMENFLISHFGYDPTT